MIIGQIDDNGVWRASDHDPAERLRIRRVAFHVRQPGRYMNEIARACDGAELTALAPPHQALAFQNVGDRVLLAVMMDARAYPRLHAEEPTPDWCLDALMRGDGSQTLRPRRLLRACVELRGRDDADGRHGGCHE